MYKISKVEKQRILTTLALIHSAVPDLTLGRSRLNAERLELTASNPSEFGLCGLTWLLLGGRHHQVGEDISMPGVSYLIGQLAKSWPHFSGNAHFPVPDPDLIPGTPGRGIKSEQIFRNTIHMWQGSYGEMRISLLNHCITALTSELQEECNEPI